VKHIDITIKGRVQGVGYRAWAKFVADQQGVTGTVKNEPNGDVTIAAEGDDLSLEMFLDECRTGSDYCTVTSVETNEGELKNYRNFVIIK
jgi:acylphosphatase